jgi:uncharacterized protein (TIGR02266 family)
MDEPSSPEGNAITLRIKFKSASLDEFVARYGADVSAGGIFIRTKQPLAVGSLLRFDFSLADGSPLLAGMGTVVWVREPDQSRVGSIPGMGLRFDQLAPESQPIHQQILAAKANRGDRPTGTPFPSAPAAPAARPVARPATPPPIVPRPAPAPPVAAQPSRRETSETFDEFSSGGKTEIADKPPSFYFDSLDSSHGAKAGASQEAAPAAPLEDTETDSRAVAAADSSWSEPIDIGEDASAGGPSSAAAAAQAAPADSGWAKGAGDKLARQPFDLPPVGGAEPGLLADLPPPSAPTTGATAGRASSGAVKLTTGRSWLDQAMDMPDSAGAAPLETSAEHTEEMPAPPEAAEAAPAEPPGPASGEAQRPASRDAEPSEQDIPDREAQKSAGQGKKLVVVGIVAAGLAFAGVYLLQTKPWQTRVEPVPPPTPAALAPSAVVPPAVPQVREPSQPPAQAAPPAAQAEPVKPVDNLPAPKPTVAPEKASPKVAEAAKPEVTAAAGKHPGQAAGSARKTASKPVLSPPPGSPAPAGQEETVYLLKVRSLPLGAQVLIDDEPMGQTPFQRRILDIDKSHKVTIRKPGYEPYEHIVAPSDAWVKDGNTENMKVAAKLKRIKVQAEAPSAAPGAQPVPVPEQPKKP